MTPLREAVIARLKELGKEEASKLLSCSYQYVDQIIHGSKIPSFSVAEKLLQNPGEWEGDPSEDNKLEAYQTQWPESPQPASWEGRTVAYCLPWYRSANPYTVISLMGMWDREKMRCFMAHGDAFISHSRNAIAGMFLASKCEWAFMVDDDMILPWGNADWFNGATGFGLPPQFAGLHTINRLLSHKKTLIGGLYFGKSDVGKPMYNEGAWSPSEASIARRAPIDQVKPTKWVATGCMLIHRSVFEAIDKKFPHLKGAYFSPSEHDLVKSVEDALKLEEPGALSVSEKYERVMSLLHHGMNSAGYHSKLGTGEDVIFCIRAAAAGHQPFVDMAVVCGHVGNRVYGPGNTRNE